MTILKIVTGIISAVCAIVVAILTKKNRDLADEKKKNEDLEKRLQLKEDRIKTLSDENNQKSEMLESAAKAREDNRENKEKFNTGNTNADFAASLDFLHNNAAKRRNNGTGNSAGK